MINQKTTYRSFEKALQPETAVIDSRTELDRLKFLSDYSSLINFYNQGNEIQGSWNPLLMKDPVFLLADIARFNLARVQGAFHKVSKNLEGLLDSSSNSGLLAPYFNQILKDLVALFLKLERWGHFMYKYHHEYNLKKYLVDGVKSKYAAYFFALVALAKRIELDNIIGGVKRVSTSLFDKFDQEVWIKGNKPFWQILNLNASAFTGQKAVDTNQLIQEIFNAIQQVAHQLFDFLNTLISHARVDYNSLSTMQGKYPDTALLRSFVKLQEIHRKSLNKLSEKHQDFYYQSVLGQTQKQALADQTFITADLKAKNGTFELKQGTRFNAGVGTDKKPIEFENIHSVNINSAALTDGHSLAQYKDSQKGLLSLYKTPLPKLETLKKDKNGDLLSWKLFGGTPIEASTQEAISFIMASPLLLLNEGSREIIIRMTFESEINQDLFLASDYYLSTSISWLQLTENTGAVTSTTINESSYQCMFPESNRNQLMMVIKLGSKAPGIQKFIKNKEGIESLWPMFKMEFTQFDQLESPPILTQMTIEVDVSGFKTFELFNDFGPLSPEKPYPLFGPNPLVDNSFMIGSTEIFSKPFSSLDFDLEWEGLPLDFQAYYLEYNLNQDLTIPASVGSVEGDLLALKKIESGPFNNTCFIGHFEMLQNKQWVELGSQGDQQLFNVSGNSLMPSTSFAFKPNDGNQPNIDLQSDALTFDDKTKDGFVRLRLTGPEYGFGSDFYAKVVSNIAMKNADLMINKNAPTFKPASLPYVPKLKGLTASYSASQNYSFDFDSSDTAIACFSCYDGTSHQVYQNTVPEPEGQSTAYTLDGMVMETEKLTLFPALINQGVLNLTVTNLSTPCELNLYFELTRKVGEIPPKSQISFRFQGSSDWYDLTVLSDGTQGFTRSGIIKLSIQKLDDVDGVISIGVPENPELYAQAAIVNPNGIELTRVGTHYLDECTKPSIKAGSIKTTMEPVPEITGIKQPFDSFGGRGAEDKLEMNRRVATRIQAKNRSSSPVDYYNLIQQQFPEIYYAKSVYRQQTKSTYVYVVKRFENVSQFGAFLPLVGISLEETLIAFLVQKASAFANVKVSNFTPVFVTIAATVTVDQKHGLGQAEAEVNDGLKLFLSPWIASEKPQLEIDLGLTEVEVLNFIKSMDGVVSVSDIQIVRSLSESNDTPFVANDQENPEEEFLLVTSLNHKISCRHRT